MKYSGLAISIVFFILLIVAGCTSPSSVTEGTQTIPLGVSVDSLEYETYQVCMDACPSQCLNDLYYTVAQQKEDANYCDKIESVSLQEECKNQILGIEAVSDLSKEKCLMITDENAQLITLNNLVYVTLNPDWYKETKMEESKPDKMLSTLDEIPTPSS